MQDTGQMSTVTIHLYTLNLKGNPLSFSDIEMDMKLFKESGFGSLNSLMIRDDIGQLVVGAKGKVLTLSLDDVRKKTSEVSHLGLAVGWCSLCSNMIQ